MNNNKLKGPEDITIEDVNIKLLSELKKGDSRINTNKFNDKLNRFADYALNEYDNRNIVGANIHSIKCRETKYTLEFYKAHKWRAIEQAREYKEEIENKFIKGKDTIGDFLQVIKR